MYNQEPPSICNFVFPIWNGGVVACDIQEEFPGSYYDPPEPWMINMAFVYLKSKNIWKKIVRLGDWSTAMLESEIENQYNLQKAQKFNHVEY